MWTHMIITPTEGSGSLSALVEGGGGLVPRRAEQDLRLGEGILGKWGKRGRYGRLMTMAILFNWNFTFYAKLRYIISIDGCNK